MLTRRTKKMTKRQVSRVTGRIDLSCSVCETEMVTVNADVSKVTCARCVQKLVAPPESVSSQEKSDKPRGWHFKRYFEHNGAVYSKGKEITDKKEIAALKKKYGKVTAKTASKKNKRENSNDSTTE